MLRLPFQRTLPEAQNVISGVSLFFAVGIYTAVLNLGAGGGQPDSAHVNNIVAACLYSIFGVLAFFAGSILNKLGPRYTMMIGAFGYPFYITGLWYFDKRGSAAYAIVGGCVLGVGAALLWTVSNFVAFAYGAEHQKAGFYATQAVLNTCGNLLAAAVVLGITHNNALPNGVPESVYATFFCLMLLAVAAAALLCRPDEVRRRDGQPLAVFQNESYAQEIRGCARLLRDGKTWLLLPALLCAENPLILQPTISAYWFNLRTRSLTALVTAVLQLLSFLAFQAVLDTERLTRRARAALGLGLLFVLEAGAYAGEAGWFFGRHARGFLAAPNGVDWSDPGFGGFFVLFLLLQVAAGIGPMYLCWLISSFTNEPRRVGHYAGFMRSGMACGTAIFFGVAAAGVSLQKQLIVHFAVQVSSLLPVVVIVAKYVTDTNYLDEKDVVFIPAREAEVLHLQAKEVGSETGPTEKASPTETVQAAL